MFKSIQKAAVVVSVLALGACAGATAQREANGEPPSSAEVNRMAREAYVALKSKEPANLRINSVQYEEIFFNEQELIACVSITEVRGENILNTAGQVIFAEGSSFTQGYAMLMRRYDNGWGSGIFRAVTNNAKIGSANLRDVCPSR